MHIYRMNARTRKELDKLRFKEYSGEELTKEEKRRLECLADWDRLISKRREQKQEKLYLREFRDELKDQ